MEETGVSYTFNSRSREIRSDKTGDKMWWRKCKGDEKIFEKGPFKCWHPLFLQPGQKAETGAGIFCWKCHTTTPVYRKEDKYYQEVLARFE